MSAKTGTTLMHQIAMSAQKTWQPLRGFRQLADIVASVKFIDGIDERPTAYALGGGSSSSTIYASLPRIDWKIVGCLLERYAPPIGGSVA